MLEQCRNCKHSECVKSRCGKKYYCKKKTIDPLWKYGAKLEEVKKTNKCEKWEAR